MGVGKKLDNIAVVELEVEKCVSTEHTSNITPNTSIYICIFTPVVDHRKSICHVHKESKILIATERKNGKHNFNTKLGQKFAI